MTATLFIAVAGMTLVAILLVLSPLLRHQLKARRRAGGLRAELKTLNAANAAGTMSPEQYAASRYALGEAWLDYIAIEPKRSAPMLYSVITVVLLIPLAAFGLYRWRGAPPTLQAHIGDADFEREYAAAESPNADSRVEPEQCSTPGMDVNDACTVSGITVRVSLDPKLKDKVRPSDTLFVFAKAAQGPAMPLAIARLSAAQLPASVTLSDAMSMMPNLTISKFGQIVLGARISKSGNASPQKGDYQTVSSALANSSVKPISLTIDRVVE